MLYQIQWLSKGMSSDHTYSHTNVVHVQCMPPERVSHYQHEHEYKYSKHATRLIILVNIMSMLGVFFYLTKVRNV